MKESRKLLRSASPRSGISRFCFLELIMPGVRLRRQSDNSRGLRLRCGELFHLRAQSSAVLFFLPMRGFSLI